MERIGKRDKNISSFYTSGGQGGVVYGMEGMLTGEFFRQTGRHKFPKSPSGYGMSQFESSYAPVNPRTGTPYNFNKIAKASEFYFGKNTKFLSDVSSLNIGLKQPKGSDLYKSAMFTKDMISTIGGLSKLAVRGEKAPKLTSADLVPVGGKPLGLSDLIKTPALGSPNVKNVKSGKPKKKKKSGVRLGGFLNPLNIVQYGATFITGNKYKRRDMEARGYMSIVGKQVNSMQTYRGNSGW